MRVIDIKSGVRGRGVVAVVYPNGSNGQKVEYRDHKCRNLFKRLGTLADEDCELDDQAIKEYAQMRGWAKAA